METLVYECHIDDTLTFEDMKTMPLIDRLRLMMSCSSEEMYIKNVKRWLLPFLQRCNHTNDGCSDRLMVKYLISMAKIDLGLCLKIFRASKADQPDPIIDSEMLLITVALECIYACESTDQLSNAFAVLECLPERGFGTTSKLLQELHNQVDELECQLSAAEILENNDLSHTIAFIRDTQNDAEEAKKLFTKLTRVAGRKTPALRARQWKMLLADLLALQEKVYHCIKPSTCYEIFVESLLCSGRLDNIQLAGEMVQKSCHQDSDHLHQSSADSPEGAPVWKVPYERAVELVLMAAQEYFDSSANLTDSSMDLARACLNVITDVPQSVLNELDLIQSLSLLNGFGVNILPIQVRMCSDRLELIQKAVDSKPFTYKNSQRLLRLGELLRVGGSSDVERHGRVLKVIAQVALKVQDFSVAYENCYRLMEMGYPDIWPECKELAEAEQFRDIPAKLELLCFAITYCTPKMIEPILRAKCLLETQVNFFRDHFLHGVFSLQVADSKNQSPGDSPFSARGAIRQTKEILSSTNKATRAALLHVSDTRWWTKTLTSLSTAKHERGSEMDDGNRKLERQGCHPFYESVIDGCYSNRVEADYQHYQVPSSGSGLSENILRAGKLEETLTEGRATHPASEVLQQLAEDNLSRDSSLGLAFLLSLPQVITDSVLSLAFLLSLPQVITDSVLSLAFLLSLPQVITDSVLSLAFLLSLPQVITDSVLSLAFLLSLPQVITDSVLSLAFLLSLPQPVDADQCFMKHPTTAVSLQLAMYYYALQIYKTLPQESTPHPDAVYLHSPGDVTKRSLKLAKKYQAEKTSDIEFDPVMSPLADKLLSYNERLMDFAQAQTLQTLNRGIDTCRFAEDAEYRKETILGLAMSLETSVCDTAVSLAQRYNVPLWHVYMTHLEFLFDSGLSTDEIDTRIKQENLLPTLTSCPEEFHARMNKYIYPSIAGTDHEALVHYFSLLDSCPLEPQDTGSVPPITHVKLLRKIKTVASDLDYKKLVDGKMRPLDVICPILNTENVNTLAKLASKIPDKTGGFLHASVVYCAWAVKLFWEGDPAAKKKREVTSTVRATTCVVEVLVHP
ncbi:hypothetical protein NP493_1055g01018 [Ridgeia piscesae]|uniref:Sec39 domain-containing protein n=1 Tax=Ridgeia piscesae TaxID=27915 RepID=A0AAD9NK46_RIDPI|nr:hypothetical protein NP493_1055g01018 [Ridgeia piscesae]